jgi:hypothetical protein
MIGMQMVWRRHMFSQDTDECMVARSMGWVVRHDQPHREPLDLGFEDNATTDGPRPAIDLGFENNAAGDKQLPTIDLGFDQNAAGNNPFPTIGDNPFPAMGFEDFAAGNKPLPAIDLGFDQNAAGDKSLPAIDLGFDQNAAGDNPFPALDLGFDYDVAQQRHVKGTSPGIDLGFNSNTIDSQEAFPSIHLGFDSDAMQESSPPLDGVDDPMLGAVEDESMPGASDVGDQSPTGELAVIMRRDVRFDSSPGASELPPIDLGFGGHHSETTHPAELPPLDLGFPANLTDRLMKGQITMQRAIERLEELELAEDPASVLVNNHLQVSRQMLSLYQQLQVYCRTRIHTQQALHLVRAVGPDAGPQPE